MDKSINIDQTRIMLFNKSKNNKSKFMSIIMTSPYLRCEWAYIDKPDYKYNKDGVYKINLIIDLSNKEHLSFLDQIKFLFPKGLKHRPWETYHGQGKAIIKCNQNAKFGNKEFKPTIYSSEGEEINGPYKIKNGTIVKVEIEVHEYKVYGGGLRLSPLSVQLIELDESYYENPFL